MSPLKYPFMISGAFAPSIIMCYQYPFRLTIKSSSFLLVRNQQNPPLDAPFFLSQPTILKQQSIVPNFKFSPLIHFSTQSDLDSASILTLKLTKYFSVPIVLNLCTIGTNTYFFLEVVSSLANLPKYYGSPVLFLSFTHLFMCSG